MKIKPLIAAFIIANVSHQATANEPTSIEEKRGAVTGLALGAAVAGPFGAGIGAMLGGGLVGKFIATTRYNQQLKLEVSQLEDNVGRLENEYSQSVMALNKDLDKVIELAAMQPTIQPVPVQFKTASSLIETHYQVELNEIARVLQRNKDASVLLTGHSDRRGNDTANQILSEQRVSSIRSYLLAKGVSNRQIIARAVGESEPLLAEETSENNFFDRRVLIALKLDLDPQLATR